MIDNKNETLIQDVYSKNAKEQYLYLLYII